MNCNYFHGKCLFLNGKEEGCIACPIKRAYNKGVIDTKKDYDRPHGEWKLDSEYGFIFHCSCSECNSDVMKYISGTENWWLNSTPNFCPNCGADMRGEANEM